MTNADHAAWELRDLVDRAASMLQRAEDAQRALACGTPDKAAQILRHSKGLSEWIETKRAWALERLDRIEVQP
jgi:hypothetical protein